MFASLCAFFLVSGCGSGPAPAPGQTLDQAVFGAAETISAKLTEGKIAVINFATASEGLSEYVIEELTNALANGQGVTVVERKALDLIREELNFNLSNEVSDESAQSIGRMLGAQYIVTGSLTDVGDSYRFRSKVLTVETAAVPASSSTDVSKQDKRIAFLMKDAPNVRVNAGQTVSAYVKKPEVPIPGNFVRVNGGTFEMGSPSNEPGRGSDEGPQHMVTVSSFYMGKYEVTQKEWEELMVSKPSYFKGDSLPVEQVSWYDAVAYCNKRSKKEGLTLAYTVNGTDVTWNKNADGYRLPTEAEWEYACRAGSDTPFSTGNNITTGQANYDGNYPYNDNAKGKYRGETTAVGSFAANAWGLYDMHGNVWEWCWDWYGAYSSGSQADPSGAVSGSYRVLRGGSWCNYGQFLRSAGRDRDSPSNRSSDLGFRLVRSEFH